MKSSLKPYSLVLIFLIAISAFAQSEQSIRWDLQVTDPEYELKNYRLDDKTFKPYLEKTSWRCTTTETEAKGKLSFKKLVCDYSVEKTGKVTTIVSCSDKRKYAEGFLELYDQRKDLTFQVMLTCRQQ